MKYLKLRMDHESTIIRTVVVPDEFSLAFLHLVIQKTFGWCDYHLHEFRKPKDKEHVWREPGEDDFEGEMTVDEAKTAIGSMFSKKGDQVNYTYDFGDGNEVEIKLMAELKVPKISDFDAKGPMVVEDCGGVGGMAYLIELAQTGKGKEYREARDWMMEAFNRPIEDLLNEPSADDICFSVYNLVKAACVARPKAVLECWKDYLQ